MFWQDLGRHLTDGPVSLRVDVAGGGHVTAQSVDEARSELTRTGDQAERICLRLPQQPDLASFRRGITVVIDSRANLDPCITYRANSPDETEAAGWVAVMKDRYAKWLAQLPPRPVLLNPRPERQPSQSAGETVRRTEQPQELATNPGGRTSADPDVAEKRQAQESWLARTWRDHTVTFIGTVVATVLAAYVVFLLGWN